ncbi:MAG: hypothetical protein ACREA0_28885 [bacterium]
MEKVSKRPAHEPSHEVRAQLLLAEEGSPDIPLTLALSRLQPLPNVIDLVMDGGRLLIPTRYARGCIVWTGDPRFAIQTLQPELPTFAATSRLDGHRRAHAEWVGDSAGTSIVDGPRFLWLSRIMELLWDPKSRA